MELPLINKVFPITTLLVEEPISSSSIAPSSVWNLNLLKARLPPPWISEVP